MPVLRSMSAVAVSLWCFGYPGVAHADPIVISSGWALGNAAGPGVSHLAMNVQGPEFSLFTSSGAIGGFLPNIGECNPCSDGAFVPSPVVDLGATLDSSGFDFGSGTGRVDGVTYPHVWVAFSSGTITTPTVTLTALGESLVDVPFSFNALMNGYLGDPFAGNLERVFTVELTGSGRASASFFGLTDEVSPSGRSFSISSFTRYDFAQPVPEPGTLFLVGGAIATLAANGSLGPGKARERRRRLTE